MGIFISILFILIGGLFGWLCGDVVATIKEGESRKSWLGWVVMFVGLMYVVVSDIQTQYFYNHRKYNYDKYEIVNDTTITNHNGQIDTLTTFKIVKK